MSRPPRDMRQAIVRNLPEKTGKSLDEWLALLAARGPGSRKEHVAWLKSEHGLGHGQASTIVEAATKGRDFGTVPAEGHLEGQYSGPKAAMRPIYDAVVSAVEAFGDDVRIDPKKTYVVFARRAQFAVVQPSTRDRVDLGLRLPDPPPSDLLEPRGSLGTTRITHKVSLRRPEDVNGEVQGLLRTAYEADVQ